MDLIFATTLVAAMCAVILCVMTLLQIKIHAWLPISITSIAIVLLFATVAASGYNIRFTQDVLKAADRQEVQVQVYADLSIRSERDGCAVEFVLEEDKLVFKDTKVTVTSELFESMCPAG